MSARKSSVPVVACALASLAVIRAAAGQTPAPAATAPSAPQPPAYTNVRWNEDYSYLRDGPKDDLLDNLKYVPLGSPDWYASFGGQVRERYEYFNNNNFGKGAQDEDGYFLTRLLVHADVHMSPYFRVFVQGKEAVVDKRDGGPRASDQDEWDVQQAFADGIIPLGEDSKLTLRFGRQEIAFGAERLIGVSDWSNTQKVFDGFRGTLTCKGEEVSNALDLFAVNPVTMIPEQANRSDSAQALFGAYDTISLPNFISAKSNTKLEFYVIGLNQEADATRSYNAETYTFGTRLATKPKPFDFEVEADYQTGVHGDQNIRAFSVSTVAGVTFDKVALSPRPFVGFDYASGDSDPGDGTYHTFNQLFPTGHQYFGYIDVIGRDNVVSPNAGVDLTLVENATLAKKVCLRAQYLAFWKAESADSLYAASGSVLARSASSDTFIGQELDLLLSWQVERHTLITAGYCHFFAGDFIHSSDGGSAANDHDIDFLYVAAQFTF